MHFVVIARDAKDESALERRMAAREAHLAMANEYQANGNFLMAAAILNDDGDMCGSVMTVDFESREAIAEWLNKEPYVKGDVWEDVEILEAKIGPNFQKAS